MYSGFPTDCVTQKDKEAYTDSINKGMNWTAAEDQIKLEDIEDNVSLRNFYKLLSNSEYTLVRNFKVLLP